MASTGIVSNHEVHVSARAASRSLRASSRVVLLMSTATPTGVENESSEIART